MASFLTIEIADCIRNYHTLIAELGFHKWFSKYRQRKSQAAFNAVDFEVSSQLAPAHLAVPVQLRRCIKIHTSKAIVASHYSYTTCFGPTVTHSAKERPAHQQNIHQI
jgi:hypothetical protein